MDKEANARPIFYSWINATCHPEWLKHFEVDAFQIPTVVFYYPEKERRANLIGQFDKATVQDHEDRFLKGKLAGWKPKTPHSQMKMEAKDCSLGFGDSSEGGSSDLDDEILRENMQEEEERRKQAEQEAEEEEKKAKKKKKGKKDKKGKKGKKSAQKDEL